MKYNYQDGTEPLEALKVGDKLDVTFESDSFTGEIERLNGGYKLSVSFDGEEPESEIYPCVHSIRGAIGML